jgi:cobyrinic acid a,c-diamide synthase
MKKVVIAATHSGAGKTTITSALMAAFTGRGMKIAPFKVGPDYIDPMFHRFVTGNESSNLDSWMLDESTVSYLFHKNSAGSDLAVIEGVMGVFDGSGTGEKGSTAHVSKITGAPVILVVDAGGMSRSIAALINGYCNFDPGLEVIGVILNNISGERHFSLMEKIIGQYCDVPCLGYFPVTSGISIPERHLGLVPAEELDGLGLKVKKMAELAAAHIDMDRLYNVMRNDDRASDIPPAIDELKGAGTGLKIAVARDRAFNFYYTDNLSLMKECGMELVEFSPIEDKEIPHGIDAVYLGGGFPEVFAAELSSNTSMLEDMRSKCNSGMPVYAECGGLMYLTSGIYDLNGKSFPMTGYFRCRSVMTSRLQRFGYVNINFNGITVRGHEFHHAKLEGTENEESVFRYRVTKEGRDETWACGLSRKNVLAGYPHVHFYSSPEFFTMIIQLFRGKLNDN